MDWISMTVRTTTEGAEAVSAMFMELGIMARDDRGQGRRGR